jgi:hypothetical protein
MNSFYKQNFGKFIVLSIYIILVLLLPLPDLAVYFIEKETEFGKSVITKDVDQFFKQYITSLKDKTTDQTYSLLSPEARQHTSTSSLLTFATAFANITDQIERIEGNMVEKKVPQGYTQINYDLTYEIQNNDPVKRFIQINIEATKTSDHLQIVGIHTWTTNSSVNFRFHTHDFFLILSILLPLFIIYTAFRYLYKAERPTWRLFLVILLLTGFINFSNGSSVNLNVGLHSFVTKTSGGPWVFYLPIPIGAIYYYFVRRKVEKTKQWSRV